MTKSKLETGSELASPVLGDDPEDGVEVGLEGQTAEKLLTASTLMSKATVPREVDEALMTMGVFRLRT